MYILNITAINIYLLIVGKEKNILVILMIMLETAAILTYKKESESSLLFYAK
jgi:hypothetical protein